MKIASPHRATCAVILLAIVSACGESPQDSAPQDGGPRVDARPKFVVGVDRDFPPYSFVDDRGDVTGFTVDLTHAVAEHMGFEVELRAGSYSEIVAALERGEVDIVPHLTPSPELEERFAFSLSHLEVSDGIFVRRDSTGVFTEGHLHERPTLVWQADAIGEPLDDIARRVLDEASVAETLRRLAAGEGDCALVPDLTGVRLAADLKLSNLRIAGSIKRYTRSLAFAVRIEDHELLEQLEEGLTLITTTDRYPELYDAWFGVRDESVPTQVLIRWVTWISVPLLVLAVLAFTWNASLRRTVARRTAELAASEERLQGILDNAPMTISMKDAQGRYLLVNRQFEELVGRHRNQLRDARDSGLFGPDQVAELQANDLRVLETGEIYRCEEIFPTDDGPRTLLSVRFPLHDADGGVDAVCAINVDVTDQKQAEIEKRELEAQMQQTQKLESLGVLAGGIAHDFNNLLMGILGNTGLALLEVEPSSPLRRYLLDVESAGKRAAELCRQMLAYSGRGRFLVQPVDLSQMVLDMAHLLNASISKKAVLDKEFAPDLPLFEADATQIRQVVMNLVTNASEALGDGGGTITVRTGVMDCDAAYLRQTYLAEDLSPGRYVYLEVEDTGSGMDAETRKRIFDPFFSTKFAGRGLGLAATLGIVRGHRGTFEVDSAPQSGTTVRVLFPVSDQPIERLPEAPEPTSVPAVAAGDRATILVVDDETIVVDVARRVLENAGYRVLTAADGEEGFELFRRHAGEISVVLLDVTMPRMNGDETYRRMRGLRDDVRVLMTSGYDERDATRDLGTSGLAGFIQKPYAPTALLRKIREVMI